MDVICFLQWSGSGIWILLGWVCHWKGREDVEFPKAQWVEEACQAPPYYLKGILLKVRTATVNLSHSWFCPIILIINYLFLDPNSSFPTKQRKKCSWILRIIWKKKKQNKGLFSKLCAFWFPSSLVWTKFYFTISYCSLQILPGASVLALQEL